MVKPTPTVTKFVRIRKNVEYILKLSECIAYLSIYMYIVMKSKSIIECSYNLIIASDTKRSCRRHIHTEKYFRNLLNQLEIKLIKTVDLDPNRRPLDSKSIGRS